MDFKVNSYVKWSIQGGWAFGKVTEIKDPSAKIELPNKQVANVEVNELVAITEAEYKTHLHNLIKDIIGENVMAEQANLESQLVEVTKTLESYKTQIADRDATIANLTQEVTSKVTDLTAAQTKVQELQNQINSIELARKGEARFNEIKSLSDLALNTIDADPVKAKETLSNMTDPVYAMTLNMAQAFVKLTQITQTSLPKSTDQSVTAEPKLTEQVITASVDPTDNGIKGEVVNVDDTSASNNKFESAIAKFVSKKKE